MNISSSNTLRQCTSCQMCAAICPKSAIQITLDEEGFYRPNVDDGVCVDCGLCVRVCYKYDDTIGSFDKDKLDSTVLYSAFAKDSSVLGETTSGGIADLLARELHNEGYYCVGVVYDSIDDKAIDVVVTSEKDLDRFRGSKYIQSYTYEAFKRIVESSKTDRFAVFGTPCQIYALDKYLNMTKKRDRFMLIDLYCHGCPTLFLWKKYILEVKSMLGIERVASVNFRSKVKGWGRFNVSVRAEDKQEHHSSVCHNEFFDLFFCDQLLNQACNDCLLRSTLDFTDIRLGDFWGKRFVSNHAGVSAVSVVSQRASCLIDKIRDEIEIQCESYSDFLPWQSWGKKYEQNLNLRRTLLSQIKDPTLSLKTTVNYVLRNQSVKNRLTYHLRRIVSLLPQRVEGYLRHLFYSVSSNE